MGRRHHFAAARVLQGDTRLPGIETAIGKDLALQPRDAKPAGVDNY